MEGRTAVSWVPDVCARALQQTSWKHVSCVGAMLPAPPQTPVSSGLPWPERPETLWELASVHTAQLPGICTAWRSLQWAWASGRAGCPHVTRRCPFLGNGAPGLGVEAQLFPAPRLFSGSELGGRAPCLATLLPAPAPQAFSSGLRRYLHHYRACVLSTPPTRSLLTIGVLFKKLGRQLR